MHSFAYYLNKCLSSFNVKHIVDAFLKNKQNKQSIKYFKQLIIDNPYTTAAKVKVLYDSFYIAFVFVNYTGN